MSSLFPYKIKENIWFKADNVNESDIGVIVDTSAETIWFFEGSKSTARNRSIARNLLAELKKKYVLYKFKRINEDSPEPILLKLETLRKVDYNGRELTIKQKVKKMLKIIAILSITNIITATICSFFVIQGLFWSETTDSAALLYYNINVEYFYFYINSISIILLISFLGFLSIFLFGAILKKKQLLSISALATLAVFVAFFIVRVWDVMIFFELNNEIILIRKDVLVLFILNLEILSISSAILGIFLGIIVKSNFKLNRNI